MAKTKIKWCDEVWNPIWGCHRGCPYCYARKFARRFGKTERERAFIPTVRDISHPRFARSTKRVFVGSMSDAEYWDDSMWHHIITVVRSYPDIDFIFLTKGSKNVYHHISRYRSHNVILGLTRCTCKEILEAGHPAPGDLYNRWLLNIEPLQEPITDINALIAAHYNYDWIIVGAETGRRKGKPVPTWEWINRLGSGYLCGNNPPALFMKPSLLSIVPDGHFRQEFPQRLDGRLL